MPIAHAARRRQLGPAHRRAPPHRGRRRAAPRGVVARHASTASAFRSRSPARRCSTTDGALQGIVLVARDVRELRQLLADKEAEIARRRGRGRAARREGLDRGAARADAHAAAARRAPRHARHARRRRRPRAAQHRADPGRRRRRARRRARAPAKTSPRSRARILPDLERVGEHITQHGQRLMQLARPGPDHVAPIDLNDVVRDVAAMLQARRQARPRRASSLSLDDRPSPSPSIARASSRSSSTSMVNAVDAIGDDRARSRSTCRPSATASASCARSATPAPASAGDQLEKIFEPFFTTKGDDGTGLGLPVVREIVDELRRQRSTVDEPARHAARRSRSTCRATVSCRASARSSVADLLAAQHAVVGAPLLDEQRVVAGRAYSHQRQRSTWPSGRSFLSAPSGPTSPLSLQVAVPRLSSA